MLAEEFLDHVLIHVVKLLKLGTNLKIKYITVGTTTKSDNLS